jgi:hypothetical protein
MRHGIAQGGGFGREIAEHVRARAEERAFYPYFGYRIDEIDL